MAKAKKNVFQEFMQDDYVPERSQYIVKYVAGRGNNLHEVQDYEGRQYLVSMPKKFRQTVWLKKNDCLVIDPIVEGKKVRGEIICVIPLKNVINLIETGEWTPSTINTTKDELLEFFQKHLQNLTSSSARDSQDFMPSDESDSDTEDTEEESDDDDINSDVEDNKVTEDCNNIQEISK